MNRMQLRTTLEAQEERIRSSIASALFFITPFCPRASPRNKKKKKKNESRLPPYSSFHSLAKGLSTRWRAMSSPCKKAVYRGISRNERKVNGGPITSNGDRKVGFQKPASVNHTKTKNTNSSAGRCTT